MISKINNVLIHVALIALTSLHAGQAIGVTAEPLERYPTGTVILKGRHPDRKFNVWVAATDDRREQGLMYIKSLAKSQGMLFLFDQPDLLTFWMKNTFVPLDIIYVGPDHRVVRVAENAIPQSLTAIPSGGASNAVLEINGGMSRTLGVAPGDTVEYQINSH